MFVCLNLCNPSHSYSETHEVIWYKVHNDEQELMPAAGREGFMKDFLIPCVDYVGLDIEAERRMFEVKQIFIIRIDSC